LRNGPVDVLRAANVAPDRHDVAVAVLRFEIEHGHPSTGLAEERHGRRADPARSAGDQRRPPTEVVLVHTRSYIAGAVSDDV
jgi:hypothetical protein